MWEADVIKAAEGSKGAQQRLICSSSGLEMCVWLGPELMPQADIDPSGKVPVQSIR